MFCRKINLPQCLIPEAQKPFIMSLPFRFKIICLSLCTNTIICNHNLSLTLTPQIS